jgi:hypothetical protein
MRPSVTALTVRFTLIEDRSSTAPAENRAPPRRSFNRANLAYGRPLIQNPA